MPRTLSGTQPIMADRAPFLASALPDLSRVLSADLASLAQLVEHPLPVPLAGVIAGGRWFESSGRHQVGVTAERKSRLRVVSSGHRP